MFRLTVNMHLQKKERNFADWILEVFNGTVATVESLSDKHREGDQIAMPTKFMIPNSEQPVRSLTDAAYPDFINNYQNLQYLRKNGNIKSNKWYSPWDKLAHSINGSFKN